MAVDMRRMAIAAVEAAFDQHEQAQEKKSRWRLSAGRALLFGAALMTAGRVAWGSRGSGLLDSLEDRLGGITGDGEERDEDLVEEGDEEFDEPEGYEDEEDEEPEAADEEEPEAYEDEEAEEEEDEPEAYEDEDDEAYEDEDDEEPFSENGYKEDDEEPDDEEDAPRPTRRGGRTRSRRRS